MLHWLQKKTPFLNLFPEKGRKKVIWLHWAKALLVTTQGNEGQSLVKKPAGPHLAWVGVLF